MNFFNILSRDQAGQIHDQALEVLEKLGVTVDHTEALNLLESAGARVDHPKKRAYINARMVETALSLTPKTYTAAGRHPENAYEVHSGMEPRLRCIGGALKWISLTQNQCRPITLADAKKMLSLADALPQVDLVGTPYVSDFPAETYDIHSLRLALSHTKKHIWSLTVSSKNLLHQMELLEAVCGGKKGVKAQNRISGIVCVIDPLKFPRDEIERLKIYGDYHLPVKWTSSSMIGGNAPFTVSGTLVQNLGQFLAGVVITQTLRPGTPVAHYVTLQSMDMRNGQVNYMSPELIQAQAAIAQLARQYELPSIITAVNSSGSEREQAVMMRSIGMMNCMIAGASEINLAAALDGGAFFCPELAVIDNEIMAGLRSFRKGISVKDDTLMETISRGIESGQYLSDPHTLKHLRTQKRYYSDLFDLRSHEALAGAGQTSLLDRAWEKASNLLTTHRHTPLDEKLEQELDRIVTAADNALGSR